MSRDTGFSNTILWVYISDFMDTQLNPNIKYIRGKDRSWFKDTEF